MSAAGLLATICVLSLFAMSALALAAATAFTPGHRSRVKQSLAYSTFAINIVVFLVLCGLAGYQAYTYKYTPDI